MIAGLVWTRRRVVVVPSDFCSANFVGKIGGLGRVDDLTSHVLAYTNTSQGVIK